MFALDGDLAALINEKKKEGRKIETEQVLEWIT